MASFHVERGTDAGDVMHRSIDVAVGSDIFEMSVTVLHAGCVATQPTAVRSGKITPSAASPAALAAFSSMPQTLPMNCTSTPAALQAFSTRNVGGCGVAEIGIVGAGAFQAQALRAVIAGRESEHQRWQHFKPQFVGKRFAGGFWGVRKRMVGAHMHELRLPGLPLALPVLRRPCQFGAQRIRIGRPVEEIVGRGLGLAAGAGRSESAAA